jgi:hypothetical protein
MAKLPQTAAATNAAKLRRRSDSILNLFCKQAAARLSSPPTAAKWWQPVDEYELCSQVNPGCRRWEYDGVWGGMQLQLPGRTSVGGKLQVNYGSYPG